MITRFAPSPNGYLHAGHALSALSVWAEADKAGGTALLRIDDIDATRARCEFTEAIFSDLRWLGLSWPEPVRYQSKHLDAYDRALKALDRLGVTYPCFCTRASLETDAQGHYAGTCRALTHAQIASLRKTGLVPNIRLNIAAAKQHVEPDLTYHDTGQTLGVFALPIEDIVIARKDIGSSYVLSCIVDDAAQGVTDVVRGEDILLLTPVQVLLQHLLSLPTPRYQHHPLLLDEQREKLSKSKGSTSLRDLRKSGWTAERIKADLGF